MASFVGLAAALASGISCLSDRVFFRQRMWGCSPFLFSREDGEYESYIDKFVGLMDFLEWQDKFGRARVLTWTLVPYTLATACTAISQGIFSFAIFQFVAAAFITAAARLCLE